MKTGMKIIAMLLVTAITSSTIPPVPTMAQRLIYSCDRD